MSNIFEKLDKCELEIKKGKGRKKYRLSLFNSLFSNGHVGKMGDATVTWMVLGEKTTGQIIENGKMMGYLVSGGRWSKTLIDDVAKIRAKSSKAIERDIKHLRQKNYIDYQRRRNLGTRMVVFHIPGVFERKFKTVRDIGQNDPYYRTKRPLLKDETTFIKGQSDLYQNGIGEEKPKEIKENSQTGKNGSAMTKTLQRQNTTQELDHMCDIILTKFKEKNKGTMSKKVLRELIENEDLQKMLNLLDRAAENASVKNLPAYWITLVKAGADIPKEAPKPKPTGDIIFDATPDQVIKLVKEKLPGKDNRGTRNVLVEIHNRYNEKHIDGEFHKVKWKLEVYEIEELVAIAKEVLRA